MGERTVVRFVSGSSESEATAALYIHWGGSPSAMQVLFEDFFAKIENEASLDTRYADPSYLAARFVAFVAMYSYDDTDGQAFKLDFTGLGVVPDRPLEALNDGVWLYTVVCNGLPVATNGAKRRPEVMFHDVMVVKDDATKEGAVVFQRLQTLAEAASNYKGDLG